MVNASWNYSDTYEYLDYVQGGMDPLIITCAISGGVQGKEANPNLPETPEELGQQAKEAYDAGASCIHIHMRDPQNWARNTMDPEIGLEVNARVRAACPDAIINNTTGGGYGTTMDDRFLALEAVPEMASLNLGPDMGRLRIGARRAPLPHPHDAIELDECIPFTYGITEKLASGMQERDIKPELETYHPGGFWVTRELIEKGLLAPPYVHQFVMGYQTSSFPTVPNLCDLIRELPQGSIFFVSGIGRFQLPMTTAAVIMGGHARVGLEDNVYYGRGRKLTGNGEAVERMVRIATEIGRPIATPAQAREILGLGKPRGYAPGGAS